MNKPEKIQLTYFELSYASSVGLARHWAAIRQSMKETNGSERSNHWLTHQMGAIGEFAVAKYLSTHWEQNVGVTGLPDISFGGFSIEVRAVDSPAHRLIIHPEDDADFFVLVILDSLPDITIAGAVSRYDAKRQRYWEDPQGGRPAYFVPQDALFSIEGLKEAAKEDFMATRDESPAEKRA